MSVTVRSAPLPPNTMLPLESKPGLEELPVNVRIPAELSRSPTVTFIGPTVVFTGLFWFGIVEIVGGSLTGFTVRTNALLRV